MGWLVLMKKLGAPSGTAFLSRTLANEETIRRRLATYDEESKPVLEFYGPELVKDIDATQTPLDVLREILDIVNGPVSLETIATDAPTIVKEVMDALAKLRGRVAMVIVEHHAAQACDTALAASPAWPLPSAAPSASRRALCGATRCAAC